MRRVDLSSVLVALAVLAMCTVAVAETRGVDYVLLVDNTGTMKYGNRGEMTLQAIRGFIDQTRSGDRISIYRYGEQSASVLRSWPVTITDRASKDHLKGQLSFTFSADRTDITSGVERVWEDRDKVFPNRSKSASDRSVLILMTDGKLIPNYTDYSQYDSVYQKSRARLHELAGLFGKDGVTIHSIAVGRKDKVDGDLMKAVAAKAGGSYFYVASADGVPAAYESTLAERPAAVAETSPAIREQTETPGDDVAADRTASFSGGDGQNDEGSDSGLRLADEASASEKTAAGPEHGKRARGSIAEGFPINVCNRIAAGLAVLVGVVAIGSEKRKKWAAHFTTDLFGTGETRVRGFLKPVDPPGIATARPCIGLENPGLDHVKLGVDTDMPANCKNIVVSFIGTKDGTPPTIHVEEGSVTIDGEAVEQQKLKDGDVIEIEGLQYQYLRGNRR